MQVYVHGNCQAPPLAELIARARPDWRVAAYECFNDRIVEEISDYRACVASADLIFSQPIHDGYRDREDLSLSYLRAHAKPGAALVVYPSLHFEGQLVGWRSVGFPGYGMDYHDMTLFHLTARGHDAEAIVDVMMDEDLYPAAFVAAELEIALTETRRREREDAIEAPIAEWLAEQARATQLFHVINHPYRATLAAVAERAFEALGVAARIEAAGEELLPIPHAPLALSTLRALGLADTDAHFVFPGERLTRPEYYRRAVAHLRTEPRERLAQGLRHPAAGPFLNRLAAAAPAVPGIADWRAPPV